MSRNTIGGRFGATSSSLRKNGSVSPSWSRSSGMIVSVIRSSSVAAIRLSAPSSIVPVGPVTPDLSSKLRMTHARVGLSTWANASPNMVYGGGSPGSQV